MGILEPSSYILFIILAQRLLCTTSLSAGLQTSYVSNDRSINPEGISNNTQSKCSYRCSVYFNFFPGFRITFTLIKLYVGISQ